MKILVVEDDPDIRELVTRSLSQVEYQVKPRADRLFLR
jgi:DNA-binding response OmpR family regulator